MPVVEPRVYILTTPVMLLNGPSFVRDPQMRLVVFSPKGVAIERQAGCEVRWIDRAGATWDRMLEFIQVEHCTRPDARFFVYPPNRNHAAPMMDAARGAGISVGFYESP